MGLLARGGPGPDLHARGCAAAGIQAPTIDRPFDRMDDLLDAVARQDFLLHRRSHRSTAESDDPVAGPA